VTDTTINIPVTATMTVDGVAVPVSGTAALDLNALQSALAALNVAPLDVTTVAALSPATAGTSYSASIASVLAVTGGVAPYTFAVSGLPAGLSYASGEISGTPTVAGDSNGARFHGQRRGNLDRILTRAEFASRSLLLCRDAAGGICGRRAQLAGRFHLWRIGAQHRR